MSEGKQAGAPWCCGERPLPYQDKFPRAASTGRAPLVEKTLEVESKTADIEFTIPVSASPPSNFVAHLSGDSEVPSKGDRRNRASEVSVE